MKGVIFTELVRFMEDAKSPAFADEVIQLAALPSEGAYTSVGNYPAAEALALVGQASVVSGIEAEELCRLFGNYLFERFLILYPHIMAAYKDAETLLSHVGSHIHNEVTVLYPDAQPPKIEASTAGNVTTMQYSSHRPMAAVAYGLIQQCMIHYGDTRTIAWKSSNEGRNATFIISGINDG